MNPGEILLGFACDHIVRGLKDLKMLGLDKETVLKGIEATIDELYKEESPAT